MASLFDVIFEMSESECLSRIVDPVDFPASLCKFFSSLVSGLPWDEELEDDELEDELDDESLLPRAKMSPVVLEGKSLSSSLSTPPILSPAPASCKGIFAGLTLFDTFFFFLTLLKKYQKVQFSCFTLDKDGVLVYREKKSLNQEAFIVGHFGEKEKPCHGDPS